jgi:signal transduction histidine kinase
VIKKKVYWSLQIAGWSVFALLHLVLVYFGGELAGNFIAYVLLIAFWYLLSSHLLREVIVRRGWLQIKIPHLIPKILLSTLGLSLINYIVHIILASSLGLLDEDDFRPGVVGPYLLSTMIFYLLWAMVYFLYHYIEKYNTSLKYEAIKNEIELNRLKSQLNPHFIFNALNSIRALVDENPVKAKDAITQLSSILRNSLVMNKERLTTLEEEMRAVKDYLDLESIRYEERLQTHIETDTSAQQVRIPPLMIQTLVENGIKHGIAKLKEGGKIELRAEKSNGLLVVQIRNSGTYHPHAQENPKGFGIENTRQRLTLIYGDRASFLIKNETDHVVLTEIKLPITL